MKASLSGDTTETMNSLLAAGRRVLLAVILGLFTLYVVPAFAQSAASGQGTNEIRVVARDLPVRPTTFVINLDSSTFQI